MTTRRYLVCIATQSGDTGAVSFDNKIVNIEGDLESGIEKLRTKLYESLTEAGINVFRPTILSLTPLENVRPPEYVELPIRTKQSMEQVVIDYSYGRPPRGVDVSEINEWLRAIKGAE